MKKENVYSVILDIAKDIARTKEGALFIMAPKAKFKGTYKTLYPQIISKDIMIDEKGISEVIIKLATLDGAVLITNNGNLFAYGVMIKKVKPLRGFGTKHAAAAGFTRAVKDSIAVLVDEGIDWIKVFKHGRIVLEMDSGKQKQSIENKIIKFLTNEDTAIISAAGISAAVLGFAPILVLSGTYLIIKGATGIIKKNLRNL